MCVVEYKKAFTTRTIHIFPLNANDKSRILWNTVLCWVSFDLTVYWDSFVMDFPAHNLIFKWRSLINWGLGTQISHSKIAEGVKHTTGH